MQIYRPRTAQTKAVYEMLLNRPVLRLHTFWDVVSMEKTCGLCIPGLQQPLGDQAARVGHHARFTLSVGQAPDVLRGAADEADARARRKDALFG